IGFVGSFYGYEGLDLLIEAAAMLVPRRPDVRVLLVGGGPREQALRKLAAERGIAERVLFAGRVPHAEVQAYYDLIDVLAYPRHRTRLTDIVTPLKPLEAMAGGRLFVASDVGGHRELVRDGQTGFLFPAGDAAALARAIETILARPEDCTQVREQARRFVETERTWARSVARYADVYQRLREAHLGASGRLRQAVR
ncbi:MAG TPA: glycosyltransferase, partial [Casimicrobiaceae bacterium]|nr:glycosyltransferase [Casimicrobiaceae bacterium]